MTRETYFQSLDEERALLGSILMHNSILDEHRIDERIFSTDNHRRIFEEIAKTRARGVTADIQEVGLMLPDIVVYVAGLTGYASSNIKRILEDLTACEQARGVAKLTRHIEAMQADLEPADKVVEEATSQIIQLSDCHDVSYRPVVAVARDTIAAIAERAKCKSDVSGIRSGIEKLDSMTDGFQPSDYIVIGARPSVGKTAFALSIAMHAARAEKSVGFLSLEMSDVAIMMRYMSALANVPLNCLRKGLLSTRMMADLQNAAVEINEQKLFLGDMPNMGINDLVAESRVLRKREKIDILIIDYLGLITAKSDAPRWETFSAVSQRLKSLARELRIPVVVLSQLRREAQDRRPNLSDLRETGSIEQDADVIAFLHREGDPGMDGRDNIELIVAKQRNGEVGSIPLLFDKPKMRFYERDTRERASA